MEERRRSNRRELKSDLVVKRLNGGGEEEIEIEVTDVSKTGVGFICSKPLEIGAVYESHLRIWTHEVLHAFLEIVRIEKKDTAFSYGSVFMGMSEMDAARIQAYDTIETLNNK